MNKSTLYVLYTNHSYFNSDLSFKLIKIFTSNHVFELPQDNNFESLNSLEQFIRNICSKESLQSAQILSNIDYNTAIETIYTPEDFKNIFAKYGQAIEIKNTDSTKESFFKRLLK